jgi:hypothetical protein
MITLTEAVESAKISAGQERILRQQHYDDLLAQLAEEDHYPFTMALVELDIGTRTGAKSAAIEAFLTGGIDAEEIPPQQFIENRIVCAALRRNAGWWDNIKDKVKEWTGLGDQEAEEYIEQEYNVTEPPSEEPGYPAVDQTPPPQIPDSDEEFREDLEAEPPWEDEEVYPRFEEYDPALVEGEPELVEGEPYPMPVMHPVDSSNLEAVGYDEEESLLYVAFAPKRNTSRTLYRYFNVDSSVFSGLLSAESKGKYFHQNIRNEGYPYDKLDIGLLSD